MKRWKALLLRLVFALLLTALLLECGLRLLTREEEGHLVLFGLKLLPFERMRAAQEEVLKSPRPDDYIIADAQLGWTIRPMAGSRDGLFKSDELGLRCAPDNAAAAGDAPVVLLAGDSFTHGDELPWQDTWAAQLQVQLGASLRVRNAGVPGYGTDQALLRAEQLVHSLKPRTVVLALCRDDLLRNVNVVRSFYLHWTDFPWTKPRFVLRDHDLLTVVNQPTVPPESVLQTVNDFENSPLCADDLCFRPGFHAAPWTDSFRLLRYLRSKREHRERHEALLQLTAREGAATRVTVKILQRFVASMRLQGIEPLVLFLPQSDDLPRYQHGTPTVFAPLQEALRMADAAWLDMGPVCVAALKDGESSADLFVGGTGHPNARMAALIAGEVARLMRR